MLAHVVRKAAGKTRPFGYPKRAYASATEATVAKYTQHGNPATVLKYAIESRLQKPTSQTNTLI